MKLLSLLFLIFISSCAKDAITISKTNNSEFDVAFLFEYDNCKVYRFNDDGYHHYFTNCTETVSKHCTSNGKTKTCHNENIRSE